MRILTVCCTILSILLLGSLALAVPDPGNPDTVFVVSKVLPSGTESFTLDITFYNDEELQAVDVPLIWDSPDITCDSASFVGSRLDYIGYKLYEFDNAAQAVHAGAIVFFEDLIQPGEGLAYRAYFSVAPGAADQVVTFDSSKYGLAGDFVFTLGSGSNIFPQFVSGTVQIGEITPPALSVSPSMFEPSGYTGVALPSDQIAVTNTGGGFLNWTAANSSGWLSIDPTSGVGDGTINLTYDVTGLTSGTYYDTVVVSDPAADNSPQKVPVTLTLVDPPCLQLSTNTISFEGFADEIFNENLQITNCGEADLEWSITGIDASWLSTTSSSGTNDQQVTFICNTAGMLPGLYSDVVTVTGVDAQNSPQDITVNLTVNEVIPDDTVRVATVGIAAGGQAVVDISYENFSLTKGFVLPLWYNGTGLVCDSVSFVGSRVEYMELNEAIIDNDAKTIMVGAGVVSVPPLEPGFGTIAKLYFSVDPDAADQFVPIDSAFIPPGTDFAFTDEGGVVKHVEFFSGGVNISGVPCFSFPTSEIVFTGKTGEHIPSLSFPITNTCGGTLDWSASFDAPWLTITPMSGTQADAPLFEIHHLSLDVGSYSTVVTFESNGVGTPFEVTVRLELSGNPVLGLSTTEVDLGSVCLGESAIGTFEVTNVGTGDMNWTVSSSDPITFTADNGTAPSTVEFTASAAGLAYGPQLMEISVVGTDAQDSPQTVTVLMNVINCTDCSFDIADVEAPQGYSVPVPIYAFNVSDVVGFEYHIECLDDNVTLDSITSDYIVTDIIWQKLVTLIHIVWVDIDHPITVDNGDPIITLWMTTNEPYDHVSLLDWHEGNEVVGIDGNPILGLGYCDGSITSIEPTFDVAGSVMYYDHVRPVADVTVDLTGDAVATTYTDMDGNCLFADLPAGNYTVTPSRSTNDSGSSIADVIMIQRHLAYIEPFDVPCEMIAADVNLSTTVSVADAVIVEMYLAQLIELPSGNWTFVDNSFGLTMVNWFAAPHSMDFAVTNADIVLPYFIGIRMGDVNNSWMPTSLALKPNSAGGVIALDVEDVTGAPGELITVPITISSAGEIAGLELHLDYDSRYLTAVEINSDLLSNFRSNPASDAVHLVWSSLASPIEVTGSSTLATVTFQANDQFDASTEIIVSGAEVANSEGDVYALDLSGGTIIANSNGTPSLPTAYSLEQNTPNPFNPQTTIRANMKAAGYYTLTIFNVTGEAIRTYSGFENAGTMEITWDGRNENGATVSSGIYFYRFEANDFSDTRKMMLLK